MRLSLALVSTLAAVTASADFLGQDKACGDNKLCEHNCEEGRYHILTDLINGIHFGCLLAPAPITYSNPDCLFVQEDGAVDGADGTTRARVVCDNVGGTLCERKSTSGDYCIVLDKNLGAFVLQCEKYHGTPTENSSGLSYKAASSDCKKKTE